ncbi:PhnE/PtxC family ABC transporter permease [Nocardioides sp.]|uniref:PhnE/PtxC family ABC transporter permease n=1 Tax=Nocardioides sp. TaxID=35761 RepID=UPI00356A7DC8
MNAPGLGPELMERGHAPASDGAHATAGPSAGDLAGGASARHRTRAREVAARRLLGLALVLVPIGWAAWRALAEGGALVNVGGAKLLGPLLSQALAPRLDPGFLAVVLDAAATTVVFAALGTAGALVVGAVGGLVLSDVVWSAHQPAWFRLVRLAVRGLLVSIRAIHEIVWALLFVSVLGLDPLVAVLAIALPFGAQTAQVFGESLDNAPRRSLLALRAAGARPASAVVYGLLPSARGVLTSYSFYRFECAIRSAVILGVVGVGGLGQELVVSLQSRNWDEVWTLIGAVLVLSAIVDGWSSVVRRDLAVGSCSDWSAGNLRADRHRSRHVAGWSFLLALPLLVAAWVASGVSLSGLTSERTRRLSASLAADLWPPALPLGGMPELTGAVLDTVAMAVLAMAVAVVVTALVGPLAMRPSVSSRTGTSAPVRRSARRFARWTGWLGARTLLLVLRSIPPTVWAVVALFALFPGILPGAIALGLYTGGILGRLVAEAWESLDRRPLEALVAAGVPGSLAGLVALGPSSAHHLITYTLYRFEICVRDTAVVGVVGAAGLGRLLSEQLSAFRFPVVTTLLLASLAVSLASEVVGRRLRNGLRA